jgi:hypothetical protein
MTPNMSQDLVFLSFTEEMGGHYNLLPVLVTAWRDMIS